MQRVNRQGKVLTTVLKFGDYVVLITSKYTYAHYRIKERPTYLYDWDYVAFTRPNYIQGLVDYLEITDSGDILLVQQAIQHRL